MARQKPTDQTNKRVEGYTDAGAPIPKPLPLSDSAMVSDETYTEMKTRQKKNNEYAAKLKKRKK